MQIIIETAAKVIWGPFTLAIMLLFGCYLLVKSRAKYIFNMPLAVKELFYNNSGEVSPFMSLSNALAATMGTGNIVGVAAAMASGGVGALLWMQIAAAAGMMIKFSETALAVKYRKLGPGPMGYLQQITGIGKPIAIVFAISCVSAALGSGCMTQSNSAAQAMAEFSVSPLISALIFGVVSWMATGGGIKGIMKLMTFSVPVITTGYIAMSVVILVKFKNFIPEVCKEIIENAFCFHAAAGGTVGYTVKQAVRYGVARGVFSNEAGMGSSSIAYSLVSNADCKHQGMLAVAEVFIDTIICCSLTGFVLMLTGVELEGSGAVVAINAFSTGLGDFYGYITAVFIALFGLAAVCGWYTYGVKALEFLLPESSMAQTVFRALYASFSALGALISSSFVWSASDFFTGIMMLINMLGMMLLIGDINDLLEK